MPDWEAAVFRIGFLFVTLDGDADAAKPYAAEYTAILNRDSREQFSDPAAAGFAARYHLCHVENCRAAILAANKRGTAAKIAALQLLASSSFEHSDFLRHSPAAP